MRFRQLPAFLFFVCAMASSVRADTVVLKNGDRLTGTIEVSDGKDITLKTDYAGEVNIHLASIKEVTAEKAVYVDMPDKSIVNGPLTTEGNNLVVHVASGAPVLVPITAVTAIRSADRQSAYEKSLHPPLLTGWTVGSNLGFSLARGNSETTNLNIGFNADRKTLSDRITLYESSLYSTNDLPGGGVIANSIVGGWKYDRNFTMRIFAFGSGDYTHDALQSLNLRQIYTGGLGLHAINSPNTTLDLLAGANYTRESYGGIPPVNRNLAGVTVGEIFMHKIGKSTTFNEGAYFYPDISNTGEYRFSLDASSVTKINKWLGWQTTISDRYVSDPPVVGTKSNDIIFSTGINVSFTH